jgi:cytochrome bd-type quinol oxidase subunit 2
MQKRNPKKVIFLHILTLGLYLLYWCSKSRKEVNTILGRKAVPSVWLIIVPLGLFWWAWLYGEALEEATGRQIHRDSVMGLAILAALAAPSPFYMVSYAFPEDSSQPVNWAVVLVVWAIFYLIYTVVLGIFPASVQAKINKIQSAHPAQPQVHPAV